MCGKKLLSSIFLQATLNYVFALNGTSLTCETSGSRNNTIYCPNKGIHCTCESYDLTASKIYWLEPCDKILTLDTNHNVSHCEVEVKNCTSATVQANFNNSLSFKCAFNNDNMSCCACNKSNLNMTVTSNQRMPINIMCGLIRVAKIDGNSSLTLYPPDQPQPPGLSLLSTSPNSITVFLTSSDATTAEYHIAISNTTHCNKSIITGNESYIFTGLYPNTNYTIEAYTQNCANLSSNVTTSSVCTISDPPDSIEAFFWNNYINITWTNTGQCITHYQISVLTDNGRAIGHNENVECCSALQPISYTDNTNYYKINVSTTHGKASSTQTEYLFTVNAFNISSTSVIIKCIDLRFNAPLHICHVECNRTIVAESDNEINESTVYVLVDNLQSGNTYVCEAKPANSTNVVARCIFTTNATAHSVEGLSGIERLIIVISTSGGAALLISCIIGYCCWKMCRSSESYEAAQAERKNGTVDVKTRPQESQHSSL